MEVDGQPMIVQGVAYSPAPILTILSYFLTALQWTMIYLVAGGGLEKGYRFIYGTTNGSSSSSSGTAATDAVTDSGNNKSTSQANSASTGAASTSAATTTTASNVQQPADEVPEWIHMVQNNKYYVIGLCVLGVPMLKNFIMPKAFEVYLGDQLVYSSIANGKMPHVTELVRIIQRMLK